MRMQLGPLCDDLRLAARGLLRARGFAASAVLTLALGISGATVMFALVEGVLLRPLPVREQDRLIVAWKALRSTGFARYPFRAREVHVLADASRVLESVAGLSYYDAPSPMAAVENGFTSPIQVAAVTGGFFRVVGSAPALGRGLNHSDDVSGAANVLVITHGLWQRRYGGSPDVIGRHLVVGERPFTIVGVMPEDVEFPHGVEAWMTLAASASQVKNPAFREGVLRDVALVARLRPEATLAQARSELLGLVPHLEADAPRDAPRGLSPVVYSYPDVVVGDVRSALLVLFAAVGLVLLIASANVANLLLLRGEARRPELALRAALGAGPGRLARQLVAESLLLALTAGALGLTVTVATLRVIPALVPGGLPRVDAVRIDAGVLLFTVAVALVSAALAGLAPALALARPDLAAHLQSSGRGSTRSGAGRGRRPLVVTQVALAVGVTAAAGLLTRSLLRLQAVEMGLAADRLVLVDLSLPEAYQDQGRHLRLLEELVARLEAVPSIEGATPVNSPPFAGTHGWDAPEFIAEGQDSERAAANPSLNLEAVHPNYFATLQIGLVRGRGFTAGDGRGAPAVAVVSEDVAARTWPAQDPIGRRLKLGGFASTDPWRSVVGVVRPTRYRELAEPRATLYLPAEQFMVTATTLLLRTSSPLDVVARLARERASAASREVRVTRVAPFTELLRAPLARPRFNASLIGVFGLAALMLTAIGLYAVMGAWVRQRHPEIGVRVALGASPADVRRIVLGEALRLVGMGVAIGLVGALVAGRALRGLLFEVHDRDPLTLLGAALLLIVTSLLAVYLPARKAARLDPLVVLRSH